MISSWIATAISTMGYGGVVGLMAIESACIPLPSEIIMPFSGYLASTGRFDLFTVATAGALGCNIGSTLAYGIGAYGGRPAALRWGRYVLFSRDEIDRLDRFFERYGGFAVLIGRLLPVVRTFVSLPAGIAQMPFIRFQIHTFVGSWPWCLALAYLGFRLGQEWNSNPAMQAFFHRFDWAVAGVVVLGFLIYLYRRWKAIRNEPNGR